MKKRITLLLALCIMLAALSGCVVYRRPSSFSLCNLFSDNMVLQRNKTVPIFGEGTDGLELTVSFNGQTKKATVVNGEWQADLDAMEANKEGQSLTVTASDGQSMVYTNILVGDVWLCSGQSNMYWRIFDLTDPVEQKKLLDAADNSLIRATWMAPNESQTPLKTLKDKQYWAVSAPDTVMMQGAYAMAFAEVLQPSIDVPVGIVNAAQGSTKIARWVEGGENYNAMISPMFPFAFKGVLWYQGESDYMQTPDYMTSYPVFFDTMCENFRQGFQNPDMPVLLTQVAGFNSAYVKQEDIANMQCLMATMTSDEKNTYTVVNFDLGDRNNIHPNVKRLVGRRAAKLALEKIYNVEGFIGDAAKLDTATVTENGVLLTFTNTHGNRITAMHLSSMRNFEICGTDGVYVSTVGYAEGASDVLVQIPSQIDEVKGLRYAYSDSFTVGMYCNSLPVFNFNYHFD